MPTTTVHLEVEAPLCVCKECEFRFVITAFTDHFFEDDTTNTKQWELASVWYCPKCGKEWIKE